ncbi:hypothetical protein [Kocuria rosea]|nr:hypothetical protein [Kocuria rosea]
MLSARRTGEGRTKAKIVRCLKRYLARQLHPLIRATLSTDQMAVAA